MATIREILVVGPGCIRCRDTARLVRQVVADQRLACRVRLVSDFETITALQVFAPPGVIVDGRLRSVGRVPHETELRDWLHLT